LIQRSDAKRRPDGPTRGRLLSGSRWLCPQESAADTSRAGPACPPIACLSTGIDPGRQFARARAGNAALLSSALTAPLPAASQSRPWAVNLDRGFQAVPDGRGKQLSTFGAPNLDGPARPLSIDVNSQLESHKLRQLERPLSHGELTHPKVTLRALRAHERKTVLMQGDTRCQKPR
jgi:hypothetical protein